MLLNFKFIQCRHMNTSVKVCMFTIIMLSTFIQSMPVITNLASGGYLVFFNENEKENFKNIKIT